MTKQIKAIQAALTALKSIDAAMPFPVAKFAIRHLEEALAEALAEQPAQQEPVAKVCHDLDGHIGWNPNLRQLPDEGTALYTSPPTLSLAQRPHECSRSHPHENMNAMCELRTEIARLTNENARLKAMHQDDEINTYRMTLLCIRDGLQQGMSKSIQKLQAREINDVLGLPSFASYRTSPPAQQEPDRVKFERHWRNTRGEKKANRELPRHPLQPQTYIQDSANRHWVTWQAAVRSVAPPQRKPLSNEQIGQAARDAHIAFCLNKH